MRMFWTITAFFLITTQAGAAGFDSSYNVFSGDLNADSRTDLYFKAPVAGVPLRRGSS